MADFVFPFPGRELANRELSYDSCFSKIPEYDRTKIIETSWERGRTQAERIYRDECGTADFYAICIKYGLKLFEKNIDNLVGRQRYFSDYISGKGVIYLYSKSIQLWADKNGMSYDQAVNLILSHEFYHFLEITELGLTSRLYKVPMIKIGSLSLGKTGIRAMSEIGAHAFAGRYAELMHLIKEEGHE